MYRSGPEALAYAKSQLKLGPRARRDDMYDALMSLIPVAEAWQKECLEAAPVMDTIRSIARQTVEQELDR